MNGSKSSNGARSKARQKAIEQGKLVESINALSPTDFIQRFDIASATLEANAKLSYQSGRDLRVDLLFAQAMKKEHKNVLDACFRLIEQSSAGNYKASEIKWSPTSKRKEMVLPDLRYLVIRENLSIASDSSDDSHTENPDVWGFVSFMVTYEDGFEVVYVYEIHLAPKLRGQGIGKVLMQMVEEIGEKARVNKCMLTVFKANDTALKWYARAGYVVDDFSPGPRILRNGTVKQPSYLIMSKLLKGSAEDGVLDKKSMHTDPAKLSSVQDASNGTKNKSGMNGWLLDIL
ncbi:N alpha-acetyl-transferase [Neophaeococcomyces mojaviensis]|uniref:N alpha-acetyl-transferase n=1 Tax=Neophaeococcomyces mojaviensis TaxID=3383035 RepID=A0ACC2ZY27_9EURO|nr:N alpha-acetyl-transferase [Knufia sp. JES_112]